MTVTLHPSAIYGLHRAAAVELDHSQEVLRAVAEQVDGLVVAATELAASDPSSPPPFHELDNLLSTLSALELALAERVRRMKALLHEAEALTAWEQIGIRDRPS